MVRASRLKLPPWQPRKPSWLLFTLMAAASAAFWARHITVAAVICTAFTLLMLLGFILSRFEIPRRQALAAKRPAKEMCSFARSFDFRRTDTLIMRAIYDEFQPTVSFPIRASHRLVEDLKIDGEDFSFDYVPSIAERVGRSLRDTQKNPYYGRIETVADLVHFMAAQPPREATQTA